MSKWARWRLQLPAYWLFTKPFVQAQIKENIKAPRHWSLGGEFTGDSWIPRTKASNAENISNWWRHHVRAALQPIKPCSTFQSNAPQCALYNKKDAGWWVYSITTPPYIVKYVYIRNPNPSLATFCVWIDSFAPLFFKLHCHIFTSELIPGQPGWEIINCAGRFCPPHNIYRSRNKYRNLLWGRCVPPDDGIVYILLMGMAYGI